MDDKGSKRPDKPAAPPPPEELSAEHLERLRDRAHEALASQRRQATGLEARIAGEVERISAEVAEAFAEQSQEAADEASAALTHERETLAKERGEWEQLRDQIEANLETLQESLQAQATQQQQRSAELAEEAARAATQKQELARWASELAEEREATEAARRGLRRAADGSPPAANDKRLQEELRSAEAERDKLAEAVRRLEADLASTLESEPSGAGDDAVVDELRAEWAATLQRVESERDAWALEAEDAERRLEEADRELASAADLQEKFSLALNDVQEQRRRIAELEQEIASRPAAGADESAELSRLREERIELQRTIEVLRARPGDGAARSPADDDLQRRFELAVEDVRALKTENAELQQRLVEAEEAPPAKPDDAQDWESQKRRMLASLEGGDQARTDAEPRATIEGTIRITDEVVAAKEQRIAELEAELAGGVAAAPVILEPEGLDDDAALDAPTVRAAELERELQEKLRAAELELSVERAKIAREQAELAGLRLDLEAQQRSQASTGESGGGPADARQRNWLNKLGLGGDAER